MSNFTSVPVIDVSAVFSDKLEDLRAVAKEIGTSCRDVGFFFVKGHQMDPKIIDGVRSTAKDFFAKDSDYKLEYYIGKSVSHKGYVPEGEAAFGTSDKPDHKEAFDIGVEADASLTATKPLIGPNNWPNLPEFRERAETYYESLRQLGRKLLSAICLDLGIEENFFDSLTTMPASKLRMIHYPYDSLAQYVPGIGAHTDYEFITLLWTDAPDLEVLNSEAKWIDAPPVEGAFVVNIGDMLDSYTGGTYTATAHRVRAVQKERYSYPFFFSGDFDTVVKPLPQFATPEAVERMCLSSLVPACGLRSSRLISSLARSFVLGRKYSQRTAILFAALVTSTRKLLHNYLLK